MYHSIARSFSRLELDDLLNDDNRVDIAKIIADIDAEDEEKSRCHAHLLVAKSAAILKQKDVDEDLTETAQAIGDLWLTIAPLENLLKSNPNDADLKQELDDKYIALRKIGMDNSEMNDFTADELVSALDTLAPKPNRLEEDKAVYKHKRYFTQQSIDGVREQLSSERFDPSYLNLFNYLFSDGAGSIESVNITMLKDYALLNESANLSNLVVRIECFLNSNSMDCIDSTNIQEILFLLGVIYTNLFLYLIYVIFKHAIRIH